MFTALNTSIDTRLARRKDGEKGFTLIELLVVVIIIGILAAIAIPVFLNQRQSAWKASVASDLKNAATVVETYGTTNNGSYKSFAGIAAATGGTASSTQATPGAANFKVSTGNTITVKIPADGNSYTLVGINSNVTGGQKYDSANGGVAAWNSTAVPSN